MSAKDLITKWEEAIGGAQAGTSPAAELSDHELEATALPGIGARFGFRAGCSPASCPGTYCDTCGGLDPKCW